MDVRDFIKLCNECEPLFENPGSTSTDPAYTLGDRINEFIDSSLDELRGEIQNKPADDPDRTADLVFIYMLKKEVTDDGRYTFDLEDSRGMPVRAEVDPFEPFGRENGEQLNQKWHVLISLLAYCDIAHKLHDSKDDEERDLYQWISSYDLGKLETATIQRTTRRGSNGWALEVVGKTRKKRPVWSHAMMDWVISLPL